MAESIILYNTLSRSKEPLLPINPGQIKMYTCGPTVYGRSHIGNFRTYIFEDVLVRTLQHFGYKVHRVMNVTDVGHLTSDEDEGEDKMELGAREEKTTAWDVAKKYERLFVEDMKRLKLEVPFPLYRATETVEEQIDLIITLEKKGYTYLTNDGVYFDSTKVANYGELARLDIAGLQAGARVEMQSGKKHPTDFALWKFSNPPGKRHMEWESPWGIGFPGWHIECSSIALHTLGPELDIHAGGVDHIPVHHTNEIAQSEALTGKTLARHWMHGEMLLIDGGKMSKSLKNIYSLDDLQEKGFDPLTFRLFTYSASYRSKLNFTWESLQAAQNGLERLQSIAAASSFEVNADSVMPGSFLERFEAALRDDLNLPEAMAVVWELARSEIRKGDKWLFFQKVEPILQLNLLERAEPAKDFVRIPGDIMQWVKEREDAREAGDWALADELRNKIEVAGYLIKDTKSGPVLDKK